MLHSVASDNHDQEQAVQSTFRAWNRRDRKIYLLTSLLFCPLLLSSPLMSRAKQSHRQSPVREDCSTVLSDKCEVKLETDKTKLEYAGAVEQPSIIRKVLD